MRLQDGASLLGDRVRAVRRRREEAVLFTHSVNSAEYHICMAYRSSAGPAPVRPLAVSPLEYTPHYCAAVALHCCVHSVRLPEFGSGSCNRQTCERMLHVFLQVLRTLYCRDERKPVRLAAVAEYPGSAESHRTHRAAPRHAES